VKLLGQAVALVGPFGDYQELSVTLAGYWKEYWRIVALFDLTHFY
jgi:hypothetical protein